MSRYVENGTLDAGLTGKDWIAENCSDVHVVEDLIYSKVSARPARWVLAVPYDSPIKTLDDLNGKENCHRAAGLHQTVFRRTQHLRQRRVFMGCHGSQGGVRAGRRRGGSHRNRQHHQGPRLRIIHELMQTNTQLITNRRAWEDPPKREKIEQIALLLKGALLGEKMVGNQNECSPRQAGAGGGAAAQSQCPNDRLAVPIRLVFRGDGCRYRIVVRDLIPVLLKNGAEGIIEYPLNKVLSKALIFV
jgi:ATP phosphoribosyltransferase